MGRHAPAVDPIDPGRVAFVPRKRRENSRPLSVLFGIRELRSQDCADEAEYYRRLYEGKPDDHDNRDRRTLTSYGPAPTDSSGRNVSSIPLYPSSSPGDGRRSENLASKLLFLPAKRSTEAGTLGRGGGQDSPWNRASRVVRLDSCLPGLDRYIGCDCRATLSSVRITVRHGPMDPRFAVPKAVGL